MKISVVVPVYNIEKYVARCIESLEKQTLREIEIIIIDDKSTDNSKTICEKYASKYSNIKIIEKKENQGLSEARNDGLLNSEGEYIIFVDGDDYLEENALERLYEIAKGTCCDAVIFANVYDLNNGKKIMRLFESGKNVYCNNEIMEELFPRVIGTLPTEKSDYDIGFAPWARLLKREFLMENGIRFQSERKLIYEDLMYTLDIFPYLKTVALINEPLYHYCENENSLTKAYKEDKYDRISFMYNYIINSNEYSRMIDDLNVQMRFNRTMISYIRLCLMQTHNMDIRQIKKITNGKMSKKVMENYPVKKLPFNQAVFAYLVKKRFNFGIAIVLVVYRLLRRKK